MAKSIGADMPATEGSVTRQVIPDLSDQGHVVVITQWHEQTQGEAVLSEYNNDARVALATELAGAAPGGFLGEIA